MKDWFSQFEASLNGKNASTDLVGAGSADRDSAVAHYRFQHRAKKQEAVEETFPMLLKYFGEEWSQVWGAFLKQNEHSPRNLDWFPEVFLSYYLTTDAPLEMRELARFEHRMDVHPWNHPALTVQEGLTFSEESCLQLGKYEVLPFLAPVIDLYEEEIKSCQEVTLILWQKEDGTYYRAMKDWELNVLQKLSAGVGLALEQACDDEKEVAEFFQWLGSSCLIQGLAER